MLAGALGGAQARRKHMTEQSHWETVYRDKAPEEVSWYQPHLETSLELIQVAAADRSAPIIDVGGGESTLVDDLLALGYSDLTVLDLSQEALRVTRKRLGERAQDVEWLVADVARVALPQTRYAVWHDRAVFHFLVEPDLREAYVRQVRNCLMPGGSLVIATFGPEGPTKCSGLEVARYDVRSLHETFGDGFDLVDQRTEDHITPGGQPQQFVYAHLRLSEA
jgi:SAM-dependent methyltransferase